MSTYESLLAEASELPVDEKLRLIEALWDSVPEDTLPPLSEAWVAENQRRSAEYESGKIETVRWEDVPVSHRAELARRQRAAEANPNEGRPWREALESLDDTK